MFFSLVRDLLLYFTCTDLDLECLATWRDGSESYLYSRLTATPPASVAATDDDAGDQYRCLVLQHYYSSSLVVVVVVVY